MRLKVPKGLVIWFKIHFLVDMIFGIPLLLLPEFTLNLFGIFAGEMVTARLIGAGLIGIGGASLLTKKLEAYKIMLNLKIIWSLSAILALILSTIYGSPKIVYLLIMIFGIFSAVWIYYKRKISE